MTAVTKLSHIPKIKFSTQKSTLKVEKTAFLAYFDTPLFFRTLHFLLFFCLQGENMHIEVSWKCVLNFRTPTLFSRA